MSETSRPGVPSAKRSRCCFPGTSWAGSIRPTRRGSRRAWHAIRTWSEQFQLIREEYDQSVHGNAAIADRPARNADRLLAEVARRRTPRVATAPSLWDRLTEFFAMPPVGAVRWAGAAAALLIVRAGRHHRNDGRRGNPAAMRRPPAASPRPRAAPSRWSASSAAPRRRPWSTCSPRTK